MIEILSTILIHWFEVTVLTILSGIGGIVLKMYKEYKKSREKAEIEQQANRDGTMALLEDRLQQALSHYLQQPYIYVHQKKIVMNLFRNYKNLGGNGIMDRMIKEFNEMEVRVYTGKDKAIRTDYRQSNGDGEGKL